MKKNRQYRSNQGRSPEQQETNYRVMEFAVWGFAICIFLMVVVELVGMVA